MRESVAGERSTMPSGYRVVELAADVNHPHVKVGYDGYLAMEFLATGDPVATIARARAALLAAGG